MRTPSASRVSAPPESEDAARLPCLTTGMPAAATTIAAIVDRLTVLTPSPPVPTTSTVSAPTASAGIRRAWASITSASSATSPEVGPFIFIDTPNAAICAGVAAPVMICSITQPACPRTRSTPVVVRPRICAHDGSAPVSPADDGGWDGDGAGCGDGAVTAPIVARPHRRPQSVHRAAVTGASDGNALKIA
ncbi:hypothetical protein MKOR_05330 [Mycolicibacillus koreensis]|nr:hypothetical protein MKOR_05330 [Mycolicibacillus koreensis]